MSGKEKKFPLPLSSVVKPKSKSFTNGLKPIVSNLRQQKEVATLKTLSTITTPPFSSSKPKGATDFKHARHVMRVRLEKQGISNKSVLDAMEKVPRHLFLDTALFSKAYADSALPIGHQQTISQPYIVAKMIEVLLEDKKQESFARVLEIGTGCGYQAMVLSLLFKEVYSIERIKALHELSKNRLRPFRIPNIRLQYGDGMLGLPQAAPFDAIIIAAAGLEIPQILLEQLAIGGRLVAPVGGEQQSLQLIERAGQYGWKEKSLEKCYFVPLVSGTI